MKKKNLDKIDKDLLDRYIDDETRSAVAFEEIDGGWRVSATEKISTLTELRLPIYYEEKPIVEIAKEGFKNAVKLLKIELPESIIRIGAGAFAGCSSVKEFVISEKNANFKVVDGSLYDKSGKTLVQYSLGKDGSTMIIPEGVQVVGAYAVSRCQRIKEIIFPSTMTRISNNAFENCVNLREVNIPSTVVDVASSAFKNCGKLNSVTLSEKLYYIRNFVFAGCKNLKEITIPSLVLGIEENAFADCKKLKTVNFARELGVIVNETAFIGTDYERSRKKALIKEEKEREKASKKAKDADSEALINKWLRIPLWFLNLGWRIIKWGVGITFEIIKFCAKIAWWFLRLPFTLVKKIAVGIFNWIVDWFTLGEELNLLEKLAITIISLLCFLPSISEGIGMLVNVTGYENVFAPFVYYIGFVAILLFIYRKYISFIWKGRRGLKTLIITLVVITILVLGVVFSSDLSILIADLVRDKLYEYINY